MWAASTSLSERRHYLGEATAVCMCTVEMQVHVSTAGLYGGNTETGGGYRAGLESLH
jgi:hypothetical protein